MDNENKEEEGFHEPEIAWAKSQARELLQKDLEDGTIPLEAKGVKVDGTRMTLRDIYISRPEFSLYDYKKFSGRLASLRLSMKKKRNKNDDGQDDKNEQEEAFPEPEITWAKSKAKKMLYQDIMDGIIPLEARGEDKYGEEMGLKDIYLSRPEFALYSYKKFSGRISSLRNTIKERN